MYVLQNNISMVIYGDDRFNDEESKYSQSCIVDAVPVKAYPGQASVSMMPGESRAG